MRRLARTFVVAAVTGIAALPLTPGAPAPVARAEGPVTLASGQITDKVGALGGRRSEVEAALARLDQSQRLQLFVVYVRDFSGQSPASWADTTAARNGLGRDDILLAVATGARQYYVSVDSAARLTDAQIDEVSRIAVEPHLRQNDWAGAAIGAADGYTAALAGAPVVTGPIDPGAASPGGSDGGDGGVPGWIPAVAVGGVAAAGGYLFVRHRRNARDETGGAQVPGGVSLDELDKSASRLLVATDDAVRTSEQELGFATAEFGEQAVVQFAEALDFARAELAAAFRLRQSLDDEVPEDDAAKRAMLTEITTRCAEADRRLDEQSDAFDRLRDLEANAPQVAAQVARDAATLSQAIAPARTTLAQLAARYTDSALAPIAANAEQAEERLTFVQDALSDADREHTAGRTGPAAVSVHAAESAVDQAAQLLDAVHRRAAELEEAEAALHGLVAETEADLAEADALVTAGHPDPALAGLVARARSELAAVAAESVGGSATGGVAGDAAGGRTDPIASARRVQEADAALDKALADVRDERERVRRARAGLDQALAAARAEVAAASDSVTTNRGAVGGTARTRLGEAQRHLEQAHANASADPVAALAEARRSAGLAGEAISLAQQDVQRFRGYGSGTGGGFGGGGGFGNLAGVVLGGILINGGLGGRRSGGSRGGPGPGSFGGSGTRGRRGGGGRF